MRKLHSGSTLGSKLSGRKHIELVDFPMANIIGVGTEMFTHIDIVGDVAPFNLKFVKILDDLRKRVQTVIRETNDLRLTEDDRNTYLKRLMHCGRAAYNKFLPHDLTTHLRQLDAEHQARGLQLTFQTQPTMNLFWEMLYAGQDRNHIEPEQFWGYRYPLGRRYWKTTSPDQIGIQEGAFFAINHKLKHTHDELAQVAKHIETLANEANLTLRIQHLAEALSATNLSTDDLLDYFSDAQFLFGIVHFACHCEHPSGTSATESYLSLTAREATVELHLEELIALAGEGFRQHPFVFLNACESSTAGYSMQTSNFPTDLLNFGAGSVIATACVIPDRFASAFATEFYRRLLDKERHMQNLVTLSEVLWETRLHFLREYNNPLGLAYGLYADSAQAFLIEG